MRISLILKILLIIIFPQNQSNIRTIFKVQNFVQILMTIKPLIQFVK